jgi:hypothetical protein
MPVLVGLHSRSSVVPVFEGIRNSGQLYLRTFDGFVGSVPEDLAFNRSRVLTEQEE